MRFRMLTGFVAVLLSAATSIAGELKLEGVHLCCGACVRDAGKALDGIDGISAVNCDRKAGSITMAAVNEKAATAALKSLGKAGFFGRVSLDGKKARFPVAKIEKGAKGDQIVLTGMHLCCGGCTRAVTAAIEGDVEGSKVTCEAKAGKVTVSGEDIEVASVLRAIRKAGFEGQYEK